MDLKIAISRRNRHFSRCGLICHDSPSPLSPPRPPNAKIRRSKISSPDHPPALQPASVPYPSNLTRNAQPDRNLRLPPSPRTQARACGRPGRVGGPGATAGGVRMALHAYVGPPRGCVWGRFSTQNVTSRGHPRVFRIGVNRDFFLDTGKFSLRKSSFTEANF